MEEKIYCLQWKDELNNSITNHGLYPSVESAKQAIFLWWKLNNYKPFYIRSWTKDGITKMDYGLHSAFYIITELNKDNFENVLNIS